MATSNTHLAIDPELVGAPVQVSAGHAKAELLTLDRMKADARGLVHGGFVFGLADYAAMLAVNDPYVVLGGAEVRFVAPVRVGETVQATADVRETRGKKRRVDVACTVVDEGGVATREVFMGSFTCFVLERHVLGADAPDGEEGA